VSEWCWDYYASTYTGTENPKGPNDGDNRVVRGGNWYDGSNIMRSAYRDSREPNDQDVRVGFRLVRR